MGDVVLEIDEALAGIRKWARPELRFSGLVEAMGLPTGFDCIKDEDIPQIVKWADAEANPLYTVPFIWGEAQLKQLVQSIRL